MSHPSLTKISVIITTYNWPNALRAILCALEKQNTHCPFEIIVADDGSTDETERLIRNFKARVSIPLLHIWQPNEGQRAAAIRNKAILASEGDYIVFLEGDCIPRSDFISAHAALAEPKTFVTGNRILLSREFTVSALSKDLPLHQWGFWRWSLARILGQCKPWVSLVPFTLQYLTFKSKSRWKGISDCNLGVWKSDLQGINGWEELFMGSGLECSDLIMRLLLAGITRKSGYFTTSVIRLWHPKKEQFKDPSIWKLLKERKKFHQLCAEKGLSQYEL